jgi:hypothetical protein
MIWKVLYMVAEFLSDLVYIVLGRVIRPEYLNLYFSVLSKLEDVFALGDLVKFVRFSLHSKVLIVHLCTICIF